MGCGGGASGALPKLWAAGRGLCALLLAPHKPTLEARRGKVTCGWPAVTGGVGLTSAVISQTQTWGWSLFPSFPSSTANCTRKERCDGTPATLPEKRTTGKLRSLRVCGPQPPPRSCCGHCLPQGAVKTQGRGRAWAGGLGGQGGKPVSMQHQARLFGNKRNRKRGHIAMGGT